MIRRTYPHNRIGFSLFLFFLCPVFLFAEVSVDFLFVGFDAGETSAFIEVMKAWKSEKTYGFLTLATSQKLAKESGLNSLTFIDCPTSNRHYELTAEDLKKIRKEIKTKVLISGLYSRPQAQIAELFKKEGAQIIFYWDNFSSLENLPPDLVTYVKQMTSIADLILTPTHDVAKDLNQCFQIKTSIAVGQPTLDIWEKEIEKIDISKALEKVGFSGKKPLITYIGGYEDIGNHYNESFQKFACSVKSMKKECDLLIQLHPRAILDFEQTVLQQMSAEDPEFPTYFISHPGKPLNSYQAVAIASLIACQRTNLGINATFLGKKVLYIDVPDTIYKPFTIQHGLATQLSDLKQISAFLHEELISSKESFKVDYYEQGGVPKNATQNICQKLLSF